MCYNEGVYHKQTKAPPGTEVIAVWSSGVYIGEGVAALCRKFVAAL